MKTLSADLYVCYVSQLPLLEFVTLLEKLSLNWEVTELIVSMGHVSLGKIPNFYCFAPVP